MTITPQSIEELSPQERRELLAQLLRNRERTDHPLSFAQERLWFLDQLEPGSRAYTIPAVLRWPGPLNIAALEQALEQIVHRHGSLRTTFRMSDDGPIQVVEPAADFRFARVDLREMPERMRVLEAQRLADNDASWVFDLATGPLFRATLIQLADDDHVLLLNMHHIVSDGWSMAVLHREIAALYQASATNSPDPLPPLPIQYTDYVRWQRSHLSGDRLERHLRFWMGTLGGAPDVIDLPTDRARPPVRTYAGAFQPFTIGSDVALRVREIGRTQGATSFMVLLAAFQAMLHRCTGGRDQVVGTPVANRSREETEGLIGFFINVLPLRTVIDGDPTFDDLVQQVRETCVAAYAHEELPYERIVEELQPERSMSHHPIVQVLFASQSVGAAQQGQHIEPDDREPAGPAEQTIGATTAKFDLSLVFDEARDDIAFAFEYAVDLFDHETITRLIGWFQHLLETVTRQPDVPLSVLKLLESADSGNIARREAETTRHWDQDEPVHRMIAHRAVVAPGEIAVRAGAVELTHAELEAQSNQLARHLIERGVAPGARVVVSVSAGHHLPTAILAVLKSGAAYVPLDPAQPASRRQMIIEDAGATLVLTDCDLDPSERLIDLRTFDGSAIDPSDPGVPVSPDDVVYAIYTSGSTGEPKGVMVRHGAFNNLVNWYIDSLTLDASDVTLLLSSPGFDLTQKNIFAPLVVGAVLELVDLTYFEARDYVELIGGRRVTTINCTPSSAYALCENTSGADDLSSLRFLVLGGEPIALSRLAPWMDHSTFRAAIMNSYGPTEATDVCCFHVLDPDHHRQVAVPIGRAVPNHRLHVVDEPRRAQPVGICGELAIGGVGVALGYLGDAPRTAAAFVPDPFDAEPGARMYLTGDVVKRRADGLLEFVGRTDDQVKVRGHRIELGEIERALRDHVAVDDAVAVVDRDGADPELRAFIVADREVAAPVWKWRLLEDDGVVDAASLVDLENGMCIAHMNQSETDFLDREVFAEHAYLRHGVALPEDAVVLDVGANIGLFALFVHLHCADPTVYAFEPLPPIEAALRANCAAYETSTRILNHGLGAAPGTAEFTFYPNVSILSGQYADATDRDAVKAFLARQRELGRIDEEFTDLDLEDLVDHRLTPERFMCELRTLSEVIDAEEIERVDLLKVDVEKAELDVLLGIEPRHWDRIDQVVVEVHDVDGRLATITNLLTGEGFSVKVGHDDVIGETAISNVYAVRRPRTADPARWHASWTWASPTELTRSLHDHLKERLPPYMEPSDVTVVSSIPLSANGKVDRTALRRLRRSAGPEIYVEPANELEAAVAEIFREVLELERIGVTSNFFDLGGQSLLATRVVSRLRSTLDREVSVRTIFDCPTVRQLARTLSDEQ